MYAYAARERRTLEMKDGDGTFPVEIRKLSAKSLQKAREAKSIANANAMRRMGGEVLGVITAMPAAEQKVAAENAEADIYANYDLETVLTMGIASWGLKDGNGKEVPTTDPADVLDERSAIEIHHAIIDLSVPKPEEQEAARKNG